MKSFKFIPALTLAAMSAATLSGAAWAGTATITLGSERYSLNEVKCEGGPDSFSVQASVSQGAELLQLGAYKGEVQTVGFRVGDTMAQVADRTGTFDGATFKFEGEAQVYTLDSINRRILNIDVTC